MATEHIKNDDDGFMTLILLLYYGRQKWAIENIKYTKYIHTRMSIYIYLPIQFGDVVLGMSNIIKLLFFWQHMHEINCVYLCGQFSCSQ